MITVYGLIQPIAGRNWIKWKIFEKLGRCGKQNMLWPYLKIWEWEWIFGHVVKAISSLDVHSYLASKSNLGFSSTASALSSWFSLFLTDQPKQPTALLTTSGLQLLSISSLIQSLIYSTLKRPHLLYKQKHQFFNGIATAENGKAQPILPFPSFSFLY